MLKDATSWPKQLAAAVVVDAAAPDQVGVALPDVPLCIIDHHSTDAWELGLDDLQLKWDVRSTTEVVASYLEHHVPSALSPPVCEFLLAGLVTDTARFRHANGHAFSTAARLIERGGLDYQAFIQDMEDVPTSPSDRGAIFAASTCRDDRSRTVDCSANHGWNIGGQGRLRSQRSRRRRRGGHPFQKRLNTPDGPCTSFERARWSSYGPDYGGCCSFHRW